MSHMITSAKYLLETIDELRKTNNSLAIGYEARGREIETLKRERTAPAGPRDGLPNDAGNTAGSESPASPRAAGTGLIEAAPDLLAACKALMPEGWDKGHMDHMPGIKLARLAIAKAEGRELLTDEQEVAK